MERYFQIGKTNLKYNLYPHLLLSIFLLLLSPFIMGVENLNASDTARVLEMFIALLGIILLTPVFLPEQNKDIRDLAESKFTSMTAVTIIRVLEAIICLAAAIGIYILFLQHNHCTFSGMKLYLGTVAEALFLGSMGLCAYSFFDQIAVAYMLPIMYYILAIGGGKKLLKGFYPFSMIYGGYREKVNLAIAAVAMIVIGISYPYISKELIPLLNRIRNGRKASVSKID